MKEGPLRAGMKRVLFLLLVLLTETGHGQSVQVSVPQGRRHFIVLVDTAGSPLARKREARVLAEQTLTRMLFEPESAYRGATDSGQWFSPRRDLISIVQFGFDSQPHPELASIRMKEADLGLDYVRPVAKAVRGMTRTKFQKLIHPRNYTNLEVLAWALPMGIPAVELPAATSIQETIVILLTDRPIDDPGVNREGKSLAGRLRPEVQQRLSNRQRLLRESVLLTGQNGSPGAWFHQSFGEGGDRVSLTAYRALSKVTDEKASPLTKLHPLDGMSLGESRNGIDVRFGSPKALIGSAATFTIQSSTRAHASKLTLRTLNEVHLPAMSGDMGKAILVVDRKAINPLLGAETYEVVYEQSVLLPSGMRIRSLFVGILAVCLIGVIAAWAYYQAVVARHFRLWLPGYSSPFPLPALSQNSHSRHLTRIPVENGEVAGVLELPSPLIRLLFYRDACLRWDSRLCVLKMPTGVETANLMKLPRHAKFIWQDRPPFSGEFELVVERRSKNGRNQRARVNVRFLSLPTRQRSSLN